MPGTMEEYNCAVIDAAEVIHIPTSHGTDLSREYGTFADAAGHDVCSGVVVKPAHVETKTLLIVGMHSVSLCLSAKRGALLSGWSCPGVRSFGSVCWGPLYFAGCFPGAVFLPQDTHSVQFHDHVNRDGRASLYRAQVGWRQRSRERAQQTPRSSCRQVFGALSGICLPFAGRGPCARSHRYA